MIDLKYSLMIEATQDPTFLVSTRRISKGLLEDEHLALLKERRLPIPVPNPNPTVIIQNEKRIKQQSEIVVTGEDGLIQ